RCQGEIDGRQTMISLTPTGLHILEASTQQLDKVFDENILLTEPDAAALNDLLEKLRETEK
ncbi:hypothetical protein ABTN22_18615, partial [Acinetobacter baumannii]